MNTVLIFTFLQFSVPIEPHAPRLVQFNERVTQRERLMDNMDKKLSSPDIPERRKEAYFRPRREDALVQWTFSQDRKHQTIVHAFSPQR